MYSDGRKRARYLNSVCAWRISPRPTSSEIASRSASGGRPAPPPSQKRLRSTMPLGVSRQMCAMRRLSGRPRSSQRLLTDPDLRGDDRRDVAAAERRVERLRAEDLLRVDEVDLQRIDLLAA